MPGKVVYNGIIETLRLAWQCSLPSGIDLETWPRSNARNCRRRSSGVRALLTTLAWTQMARPEGRSGPPTEVLLTIRKPGDRAPTRPRVFGATISVDATIVLKSLVVCWRTNCRSASRPDERDSCLKTRAKCFVGERNPRTLRRSCLPIYQQILRTIRVTS